MNRCLAYKILCLTLFLNSSLAWGQSTISVGEIRLPKLDSLGRYINLDLFYTHDYVSNTGGIKAGPRNIGALDLYLESDLSKYSRVQGELMIHFTHINQNDQRGSVGDTQFASNIDMPAQTDRLTDLYYQHHWSDQFITLLGVHDISMEFNITPASLNFLNSSFGTDTSFAVSGTNGPSIYPLTTVGFRSLYQWNEELSLAAGVYDADPGDQSTFRQSRFDVSGSDGFMYISELSHTTDSHKLGLGGWNYSKAKQKILEDSGMASSYGAYGMFERKISVATFAFVRFGWANPLVNAVQSNFVTGLVQRGIFQRKKNEDEAGIGYSRAHLSRSFRKTEEAESAAETVYEAYYQFRANKIISLRPDIQFIANPTGVSARDAWVMGFRTVVEI